VLAGGSAVRIDDDLVFLTNFHVADVSDWCENDSVLTLLVQDGLQGAPNPAGTAEVVTSDPALDISVLQATTFDGATGSFGGVRTAQLGESGTLGLLTNLTVIGFPAIGGSTRTTTSGQMNGIVGDSRVPGAHWIKTSATASHGNSGGGVFDDHGRLVGILSAVNADELAGLAYARPIDEARGLVDRALATVRSAAGSGSEAPGPPPPTTTSTTQVAATTTGAPAVTTTQPASAGTYEVILGDTLYGTARAFNTTLEALRAINGLTTDVIVEHQILALPPGSRPITAGDVATTPYVVVAGDTVIGIAKRFGVTPAELLAVNGKLATPDQLSVGEQLLIPQLT
jgi:LysM repeat protein